MTGLLICLQVKIFLFSIFKSVDFWSSMSCIVLDVELADTNVFKKLGVPVDGNVQGCSFRTPKKLQPQEESGLVYKKPAGII